MPQHIISMMTILNTFNIELFMYTNDKNAKNPRTLSNTERGLIRESMSIFFLCSSFLYNSFAMKPKDSFEIFFEKIKDTPKIIIPIENLIIFSTVEK